MVKTYGEVYRRVKELLQDEEGPQAAYTARELLSHVSGYSTAALMAMQSIYISDEISKAYFAAAGRILAGEPLAYILGKWSFYGLELTVSPDVLIPRDDTMAVVDLALEQREEMLPSPRILDLCTGSGCIGLALASRMKDARVTLSDVSEAALKIAKKNVTDLHLGGRVSCITADVRKTAEPFLGKFDLIISNPPYITGEQMEQLQRSVRDYEPHLALYGGEDGLDFYRDIVANFSGALKPGGWLCFEFGMDQQTDLCRLLEEYDYDVIRLRKDTGGIVRAVLAQKKVRNEYGNGQEERDDDPGSR